MADTGMPPIPPGVHLVWPDPPSAAPVPTPPRRGPFWGADAGRYSLEGGSASLTVLPNGDAIYRDSEGRATTVGG